MNQFRERQLKKSTVTAERVKATDCILVQGLESNISGDMIELYFENQRKSGGDIVSDIELIEEESRALVFFENWMGKKHFNFIRKYMKKSTKGVVCSTSNLLEKISFTTSKCK